MLALRKEPGKHLAGQRGRVLGPPAQHGLRIELVDILSAGPRATGERELELGAWDRKPVVNQRRSCTLVILPKKGTAKTPRSPRRRDLPQSTRRTQRRKARLDHKIERDLQVFFHSCRFLLICDPIQLLSRPYCSFLANLALLAVKKPRRRGWFSVKGLSQGRRRRHGGNQLRVARSRFRRSRSP